MIVVKSLDLLRVDYKVSERDAIVIYALHGDTGKGHSQINIRERLGASHFIQPERNARGDESDETAPSRLRAVRFDATLPSQFFSPRHRTAAVRQSYQFLQEAPGAPPLPRPRR